MSEPGTILVVEDDEATAELVRRTLMRQGLRTQIVDRAEDASVFIRRDLPVLVILDYRLRDGEAWPVLATAQAVNPRVPVILVTAMGDERIAAEAIHRGASDYLIKSGNYWEQLPALADRVLRLAAAERANAVLASIVEASDDAVISLSLEGEITSWNAGAQRMYGYAPGEILGKSFILLVPEAHHEEYHGILATMRAGRTVRNLETLRQRKNGTTVEISSTLSPIRNKSGEPVGAAAISRDISERRRLETELRQAQKMEVIGRLAGGVAHDFNNLLTPILSYSQLLLDELEPGWPFRQELEEIAASGRRGAALTRQLLAFSRKQMLQPRAVDLNQAVAGTEQLLRRLIGEDVAVELVLAPAAGWIRVDPGQLEQVIMNLALNARDAMPRGGTLRIETTDDGPDVPGGGLVVSDAGVGMDADALAHLFEPFYTTKPKGKGTGLGLPTVYGIVQQSGGRIDVRSEPGRGTSFRIHFPRAAQTDAAPAANPAPLPNTGSETILLAEDDSTVRILAARILRRKGYRVLEAVDGQHALALSAARAEPIHLLLVDVVMPGLSGPEVAKELLAARPGLRVLYMSGYTDEAIAHRGGLDPGTLLLPKPFMPEDLARKVRDALDRPPAL